MIHIRSLISGEKVGVIPVEDVSNVREVKQRLSQLHGLPPRFRQSLILQGTNLDDAHKLDTALDLDLVLKSFAGASPTQADELIAATQDGSVEKVESLLKLPLDPNLANAAGEQPLSSASASGHADVVRLLLEAGADKDVATGRDTALRAAARSGHADVVRLLVEAGADKDLADEEGYTALMHAAFAGHAEVVHILLEAGADKDLVTKGGLMTAVNPGYTALMLAAYRGRIEVARLLVEAGAGKDVTNKAAKTALMFAAFSGHVDIVRLLVEAGADTDLADIYGDTALMMASESGHDAVVRLLEASPDSQ